MRFTYTTPAGDTSRFQAEYAREQQKKIFPFWLIEPLRLLYMAAVFLAARLVTHSVNDAFFLMCAMVALQFLWQFLIRFVRVKRSARYLATLLTSEDWSTEISGDKIITQNAITAFMFPLAELSTIAEKNGWLYMDFPTCGRLRVPLSVFQSPEEKSRFMALLEQHKNPAPATPQA